MDVMTHGDPVAVPLSDERDRLGAAYREHLTDTDLRTLVHADQVCAGDAAARIAVLARQPALILDVLDRPATTAALLNLATDRSSELSFVSPFLVFAAAVHRTAADLTATSYAPERAAPRLRVPVFDAAHLVGYLADGWHRLFLTELLASFARTSSGVTVTRTRHGLQRRRWDDLDPERLAILLDALPAPQRPGVWRRLGDLAVFLAGVFPDALHQHAPRTVDATGLARRTGLPGPPAPGLDGADLLEWLGAGWYRRAAEASTAAPARTALRDAAEHIHQARRVLNTTADRYLFPLHSGWFTPAR